ncbi:phage tail tape measure protein [Streptomyces sp. H27-C3]|uniref:phage tail tape measure protein n=1 Tax=Streptomyces sp. H27-C3 TaxID=3046305 RepID=UPI0024B8F9F3|nr:phage tail tape measure protein [Streptomyces sp. H27-C3]MDJ0462009.1 phage tail tape measure protein [Streptomyces sp. H27-C3]
MAKPITITLLGDLDDLSRSLNEGTSDVTAFADEVEDALRAATEEAGRLGDEVANGADGAGDSLGGLAESFGGLAAAAGIAVGAALIAGIGEAMDREAGNDLLAAQLGANPDEAKRLGEAAGAIYSAGYGESIADANEALKGLWQQGLVPAGATADEMANISKKAMDVANVLGDEVGPTANSVGQMLKTGMAKNADEAFDILVKGAQEGGNKAEDLLDTFNEYSTNFRTLGLNGKDAMGLISQGLKGGARDADLVADAIKEFSLVAGAGGAAVEETFDSIGLNGKQIAADVAAGGDSAKGAMDKVLDALAKMPASAERANAVKTLFGGPGEDLGAALFSLNVDKAAGSLGKIEGAAKSAGDVMHDNASQKLTAFWRGLQTLAVDVIGGIALPAIETLADKFAALAGWVEQNKTPILTVAGILTAVMLPALIQWGVQSVVSAALAVGAWITSATASTGSALTQVAASWSVVGGWLKVGVQALISGAIVVGQWVAGAAAAILNGAIMVATWVLMGTQAMLHAARMAAAWLLAMGPIPLIIAAIVGLALLIWANWDNIQKWTGEAFEWVWNKVKAVFEWLKNLFLNFTGPGLLIKHWDTIKVKTAEAFMWVRDKAKAGLDAVVGFFRDLPGRVLAFVGSVGNAARNVGGALISKLGEGLSKLSSFGQNIGAAVGRGIKASINSLVDLLNWAIPDRIGIGPVGVDIPANPIPKIRAMGGPASGLTRVGERGPEWLNLPGGSHVVPNHAAPASSGVVVNVTSNADPHAIGREVAWALRVAPR